MINPFDFTGKKFLITGCTSGIGLELTKRLAVQGASLALLGRNAEKLSALETLLSSSTVWHKCYVKDLVIDNDFNAVFEDAVEDGNKLDGLIHCAAVADVQPLSSITIKKMEESMSVNLYSFVELVKLFSKKKFHNTDSSIVGISSTSVLCPEKGNGIYVATKAAMNVMVQSFAKELTKKNIRINTVMPAFVDTPMLHKANRDCEMIGSGKKVYSRQLLGLSTPDQIADVIMFLISKAARVITGRVIFADGGDIDFDV